MALLGLVAVGLGACASDGLDASDRASFLALAAEPAHVPIFVVSTRREDGAGESGAHGRFSLVSISVPPYHRAGVVEGPTFGAPRAGRNFAVESRRNLNEPLFFDEIAAHASSRPSSRDILVYVHGYDTSLNEAQFRTAQLTLDSRFEGTSALFTWDSISRRGLSAYHSDKESATVARDALENLLLDLARVEGVGRIHVLAHSMGAWLAMESLRSIAISGRPDLDGKLGEVMLAAPDIDLSVFSQQLARVGAEHVTVFVSNTDRVLSISAHIAGDRPRLGAMDPSNPKDRAALEALGVSVRDLSRLNTDIMGHNTFAEVPAVVRQIGAQMATAAEGDESGKVETADSEERQ
jgi:esterase/lipase superfamily enzyme